MSDLIERQKAVDAVLELSEKVADEMLFIDAIVDEIENVPSAEPERKKGKWIEVYGYATPGGDPVWKCSECGKGIHVYGIEAPSYNRDYTDGHQWVACPNCGADMRNNDEVQD